MLRPGRPGDEGNLCPGLRRLRCRGSAHPTSTDRAQRGHRRTERQTGRMPKHRACKSGGWHFVVAAMVAFFTLAVVEPVVYSAHPAEAQSGAIREIRVVGNRRVEPETVRTYLRFNAGDAYDAGKVDQSIRSLFATGLFSDVRIDREGAGVRHHGRREPGRQPGGLRGQPGGRQGDAHQRGAAQAALDLHARQGAGRRAAHSGCLPAPGPLCRLGRAEDHRARQQPRERRVRDQRGRRDEGPGASTSSATRRSRTPSSATSSRRRSRAGSTS